MAESHIDYDAKVQDALRNVVKTVLKETAEDGLQGDHHFYVAFKTQAEGVNIPPQLVSRFPDEMTIVLQHKFWGLAVHEDRFEIGLSFNQKPEHLEIPFDAIVGFVDPSVQFALQFHDDQDSNEQTSLTPSIPDIMDDTSAEQDEEDLMFLDENDASENIESPDKTDADAEEDNTNNVVTLDAFRKK
ncbi:SspB family protein [Kordiimonas aquimaris]|uniref:SspB family protein n=1 Tax=Kordiimonas aquimaris TaxID=707591 RepID=UPI0021CE78B7|nr:ClpXP protease specificity-enhancing factor SspB [Kordiimonas aquimaris]